MLCSVTTSVDLGFDLYDHSDTQRPTFISILFSHLYSLQKSNILSVHLPSHTDGLFLVWLLQNTQVTEAWNKIAESFKCTPIEGNIHN